MDPELIERLAGGPVAWLDPGRTPVARGPRGIVRAGPAGVIAAERGGLERARALIPGLEAHAPRALAYEAAGSWGYALESDLGPPADEPRAAAAAALAQAPPGTPERRSGALRELLAGIGPPGGVNPTPLLRALRALHQGGAPLPFKPSQAALQRALDARLEVTFTLGFAHGALEPGRVLAGGLCHWRRCGPDLPQEADEALRPLAEMTLGGLLHALKLAWHRDPLRAAEILTALGAADPDPPPSVTLAVRAAHPGLSAEDLAAILGCRPGAVPAEAAARALGRAQGMVVGGVALDLAVEPPVAPRPDPGFRTPRGRDDTRLFSRWKEGIWLDDAARIGLTPEAEALEIARTLRAEVVVDGFCGAGGNAIAFARMPWCKRVIALDTDPARLAMARRNAQVYGVADRIELRRGDFFADAPPAGACFLDPPWAGGEALLARAWEAGRRRYPRGAIKLPRTSPVPPDARLQAHLTAEGFPAFLTVWWG